MRILHLSAVKNWGGGENHIENLHLELQENYPETESYILTVRNSKFHQRLKEADIPCFAAPLAIKIDPRYIFRLITICKSRKIDLIHIHDPTALTLAVMADRLVNLPLFIFSKKTSFPIKDRKQTIFKYNYPKIKRILCVSEETHRISAQQIEDLTKLITIYHGTRLDNKSDETPYKLREKFDLPEEKKIVGTIGNHIRAKHLETWVDTVDLLINKRGRTDLFFVQMGAFTERTAELKLRIKNLGLEKHVRFLGFTPQASNFIPQFDLLLMTSQSEGIPQVIFEAFYHRTPVISTDVGGISEIIDHGYNGFLSPKWDANSLADDIVLALESPSLLSDFTKRGFEKVTSLFSTRKMAALTLEQYQKALDLHSS